MEVIYTNETNIHATVVLIFLERIRLPVNVCYIQMALGYQYVLYF